MVYDCWRSRVFGRKWPFFFDFAEHSESPVKRRSAKSGFRVELVNRLNAGLRPPPPAGVAAADPPPPLPPPLLRRAGPEVSPGDKRRRPVRAGRAHLGRGGHGASAGPQRRERGGGNSERPRQGLSACTFTVGPRGAGGMTQAIRVIRAAMRWHNFSLSRPSHPPSPLARYNTYIYICIYIYGGAAVHGDGLGGAAGVGARGSFGHSCVRARVRACTRLCACACKSVLCLRPLPVSMHWRCFITHANARTHTHIYRHARTHARTRTYAHAQAHTHLHTHTQVFDRLPPRPPCRQGPTRDRRHVTAYM
jgi:hypothetical protein